MRKCLYFSGQERDIKENNRRSRPLSSPPKKRNVFSATFQQIFWVEFLPSAELKLF